MRERERGWEGRREGGRQEWKGGSKDKRERKERKGVERKRRKGRKECIPAQLQLPTRPILQCFLAC